jgi:adenylosuccinate lyase
MIDRYSTPEMDSVWSDQTRFDIWLNIEIFAAEALAQKGIIPKRAVTAIKRKAGFDIDRIFAIEAEVHHDVIAFLTAVAEKVGEPARYLHYGLTSSDILDTALSVQIQKSGVLILTSLKKLLAMVGRYAWKYADVPTMGRTHGVFAEPMSLGQKFAIFYGQLARDQERIEAALKRAAVGKMSGSVGNFAHVDPDVESYVCRKLKLRPAPASNQVVQRDRHADVLNSLAICGGSLERIALEVRHLQRTEVREMAEGFAKGQKGSSSMPHKRNPIICERLAGMARLMRGYAGAGLENIALWHERDISHSSVERLIFPDATGVMYYMLQKAQQLILNLEVDPARMADNIQLGGGVVFSQRVLLALAEAGMSRERAYRIVQKYALEAWEKGGSFKARVTSDREVGKVLSARQVASCFDLKPYVKHARTIIRRTVPRARGTGK